jgi:hypothetical protein
MRSMSIDALRSCRGSATERHESGKDGDLKGICRVVPFQKMFRQDQNKHLHSRKGYRIQQTGKDVEKFDTRESGMTVPRDKTIQPTTPRYRSYQVASSKTRLLHSSALSEEWLYITSNRAIASVSHAK